ncbi:universal stress protein [Pontibacter roseus]|uniref:universal stress protein n=1 Tax=Pontibacter roseus TaxID=336989 RepID=UPI0003816AA7|nr:universal stress protein [Pontibacter roseus]
MYRILIPVDFSEGSYKTCLYALQLANGVPDAKLLLLHCFQDYLADADPTPASAASLSPTEQVTERVLHRNELEAQQQLDDLYQDLLHRTRKAGQTLHIERAFIHGLPEEEILEQIERFRPALVLMSTKGESSIGRTVFGTVSTKVVQETHVPVLTVPSQYTGNTITKVLYAANFGTTDASDIDQIRKLLQHLQPMIYCVHISDDPEEDREKLLALQQTLQTGTLGSDIRYALLEGSDVAQALQDFARGEGIDMLALTTRERTSLESLFKPSLAKKMVLHAQLPVLVFHGKLQE